MYHYERDGMTLERYNTKTESFKKVGKPSDEATAIAMARRDLRKVQNLHPNACGLFYCENRDRIAL